MIRAFKVEGGENSVSRELSQHLVDLRQRIGI